MSKQYTFGAKYLSEKIGLSQYQEMAQCLPGKYDTPEWEAFAKKAAHALNNHDELLASLKALVEQVLDYERGNHLSPNPGRKYCWDVTKRAVAAIDKAEAALS